MGAFVKQCQRYTDGKAGTLKPGTLREVVRTTETGEGTLFDFLYIGTGGGLESNCSGDDTSKFLLILVGDVSG